MSSFRSWAEKMWAFFVLALRFDQVKVSTENAKADIEAAAVVSAKQTTVIAFKK